MGIKLRPTTVPRLAAMNPVARAVARQKLVQAMVAAKIKLYMTDEGENLQEMVQEISRIFLTTILACNHDKLVGEVPKLDHALLKLCQVSEDGFRWRRELLPLIDNALDAVISVTPKLTPLAIHTATQEVNKLS